MDIHVARPSLVHAGILLFYSQHNSLFVTVSYFHLLSCHRNFSIRADLTWGGGGLGLFYCLILSVTLYLN
jgi:hypothetical protein